MNKGNSYITYEQRQKIETMLQLHHSKTEIAKHIGKSLKTIYNEINRGTVERMLSDLRVIKVYDAYAGQRVADERAALKGRPDKLSSDHPLLLKIENQIIEKKHSPEVALQTNASEHDEKICLSTCYNYIEKRKFSRLKFEHLPTKRKKRKYGHREERVAYNNTKGRSISERPREINYRDELGHWEMDTVVGSRGNGKACLLVLTERKTRYELIFKIKDRTQLSVVKALAKYERKIGYRRFKTLFRTITCDNGVEFLNQDVLETSVITGKQRSVIYYAHPYSSWERGTNENRNRMIRRWLPKGMNFEKVTEDKVKHIQDWLNSYPLRMFGYSSSQEMFIKEISIFL